MRPLVLNSPGLLCRDRPSAARRCACMFFLRVLTSKLPLFLLPICMYMISLVWQCGGVGGFMQSFILEVMSIVRAHVAALGGNALTAYHMSQCVLDNNPHKNQVGTHSLSHLKRWIFVGWFYWAFLKSKPTWIMRFSYEILISHFVLKALNVLLTFLFDPIQTDLFFVIFPLYLL